MDPTLEEMRTSWTHCKELITSNAQLDLVIAFLEDFKVQFTTFYQSIKPSSKNKYKRLAVSLVDKAFIFWKREGELSKLITYVEHNWNSKQNLLKKIDQLDSIISTITNAYTSKKLTVA